MGVRCGQRRTIGYFEYIYICIFIVIDILFVGIFCNGLFLYITFFQKAPSVGKFIL